MISVFVLSLIRESPGQIDSQREGLIDYLRHMPKMLKEEQAFRNLAIIQILVNGSNIATPFYAIYVIQNLGLGGEILGLLVFAQTIGRTLAGLFLVYVGDKWSKKRVIQLGISLVLMVPLSILGVWFMSSQLHIVNSLLASVIIFALYGASLSVIFTAFTNYLLEILEPVKRPTGIGLMNTLNSFSTIMPLLGGLIAGFIPLEVVFLISIIPVSVSWVFANKL
jgi:MFS family permease